MATRTRAQTVRTGQRSEDNGWPCPRCGSGRELLGIDSLVGLARRHGGPLGLLAEVERLRQQCRTPDQLVSVCTGCAWLTTDLMGG